MVSVSFEPKQIDCATADSCDQKSTHKTGTRFVSPAEVAGAMVPTKVVSATKRAHLSIFSNMMLATSGLPATPSIPESTRGESSTCPSASTRRTASSSDSRINVRLHFFRRLFCHE
jgi:hypothetical protein